MGLLNYLHRLFDYFLSCCKLVQNREVGWLTVDRKVRTLHCSTVSGKAYCVVQTGLYKREQQPIFKKLKLALLFNPLTEWSELLRS